MEPTLTLKAHKGDKKNDTMKHSSSTKEKTDKPHVKL
ncbi:hypothetical protein BVRB_6g152090 [Beta vulgaris subsp. vulgaris]|nr:hypothetical protein BVRB_6g152090 [Beta vulgaris subsp. vulgaris]